MADDFPITVFHNPACGTSRNVVAIIRAAGYEPEVVLYLETGWRREQLEALLGAAGAAPRDWLRAKGAPAAELGLLEPDVPNEVILAAMVREPILVNRPIVVSPKGVKLCRPSEAALDLLENKPASFTKEDGEVVRIG
ncbi:MAG: arsC [Caulobacteraceae bacterium]|nr:arsC [Caulobacteraceae bacterium]